MIDDTTSSSDIASGSVTATGSNKKQSWYLSTSEKIESALKLNVELAEKFIKTKEEDRTGDDAHKYLVYCENIKELWGMIPRRRRRELNTHRFSIRYRKYLNFKALQDEA